MLIEVHILQNHAPSNLNRDDTGSPKEAVFGGYRRARISSQCLKRSIRRSDVFGAALGRRGYRTRTLPELVRKELEGSGLAPDLVNVAVQKASGFGNKEGNEQKPNAAGVYRTAQTMFLTDADVAAVAAVLKEAAIEANTPEKLAKVKAQDLQKRAEDQGFRPLTVDIALFGRMVTSEAFLDVDASCQFAHAISTHKVDHEFDYFTAVDDLERTAEDSAGSGADMIGDTEFNSACYYKYFNVHVEGLIDNLTGEGLPAKDRRPVSEEDKATARAAAADAVGALIEAAVRVSPSAKQNSFAAFQLPSVVLVEVRPDNLPVSYANAFVKPVDPSAREGIVGESAKRLKAEVETLTERFALKADPRLLLACDPDFGICGVTRVQTLPELIQTVRSEVLQAVRHA
jgi:CRISPR system Cascade subunit CasC